MAAGMIGQGIVRGVSGMNQACSAAPAPPTEVEQVMAVLRDAIVSCAERAQELELRIDGILSPEEPTTNTSEKDTMPIACRHALDLMHAAQEVNNIARRLSRTRARVML